jgi:hypothetical protein
MVYGPGRRGRCGWQLGTAVPSVSLGRPTLTLAPHGPPHWPVGRDFVEVGDKVFPWQRVFAFSSHTCLAWEVLSCQTASPLSLFASLSHCLLFHTCTTSHSTAPTGCSLPFAPHPGYRCASDSAVTSLSQCSAVTAWHGFVLWFSLQVPPSRPLGRAWYYRTRFSLS